jgi:DNA-binding NtrC family response regulator
MVWLIPPVVLILFVTGYLSHMAAGNFIDIALQRTAKVQVMAAANEIRNCIEQYRQDLLFVARDAIDGEKLRHFLARKMATSDIEYRSFGFISQTHRQHLFMVVDEREIAQVPSALINEMRPNPLLLFEHIKDLPADHVWISPITEAELPFPTAANPNRKILSQIIYLVMPYTAADGIRSGFLLLSFDARRLRNILSVYNSPKSPIWAFPRTPEVRYSYMVDPSGWILFQSDDPDKRDSNLGTDLARATYSGTLGRPGLPEAFRPSSSFGPYWKMVGDIREGRHGLLKVSDRAHHSESLTEYFLAYSPVRFSTGPDGRSGVYGGVAYVDRSRLTLAAGYKQVDIMFVITVVSVCLVALVIFLLGGAITRPILRLAEAVNDLQHSAELKPIDIPVSGYEARVLLAAVNRKIGTLIAQIEAIKIRDRKIETISLKEKAVLAADTASGQETFSVIDIPGIVGFGTKIEKLKSDIDKAARVDVDVLIVGETGTGKQLAAEAIHHLSRHHDKAFISINCGELDENLLLDTLFGHVKGAFTEAKTDRKGAFLEADGGTLFLDEIQSASAGVQQALLRAIAMRRIKPLGSDREIDIDVRLIAATNADLSELIEKNLFRSDLYFRLKVISISTPPLREHKENLPILVGHFLRELERLTHREGLGLSRGALEKLKRYDWPGNVRELKNCLTRATVMAEGNLIQADDIQLEKEVERRADRWDDSMGSDTLDGPAVTGPGETPPPVAPVTPLDASFHGSVALNARQEKALPVILQRGSITRSAYQEISGADLPSRTALYDLKDLVEKGILVRVGQGPATRYLVAKKGRGK